MIRPFALVVTVCLLNLWAASAAAFGQQRQARIGSIDFYGYSGLNVDQIRAAVSLREGELYRGSVETLKIIEQAVQLATGRPPTDIEPVCCDEQGNFTIFIGLPGNSSKQLRYNPVPKGAQRLPGEIVKLYDETMEALRAAVLKGNISEDTSRGYSLSSSDEMLRSKQLAFRAAAVRHERLLRAVLTSSSDTSQRIVAADALGYARQSSLQISALVHATNDADESVRNNATRALAVLASSNPKRAARIPTDGFIEMLSSGSWTDRNKAGAVLDMITRSRPPRVLRQLRSKALDSLIEMARWRSRGHSSTARVLLGRIAGIDENRLIKLVSENNPEEIISTLRRNP